MSTTNSNNDGTETNDLDDFSAEFFGQNNADSGTTNPEVNQDADDEVTDAPSEEEETPDTETDEVDDSDDNNSEDDDSATEDDDTDGERDESPKPKKNRFQERIDELTASRREAEREAENLRLRLEALEAKLTKDNKSDEQTTNTETKDTTAPAAPSPNDKGEDGEDKYPLGEFDPAYVRDLARFEARQEWEEIQKQAALKEQQKQIEEARNALVNNWSEKLSSAQERYPDFEDKGQQLVTSFQDIDPAYGEHLTSVLMSLDNGPDVLYYLANNRDVADTIIKSGATNATIALAQIDATFKSDSGVKPNQGVKKKVSSAPEPPPRNRGSAGGVRVVTDDTDDLDAFSAKFFKKG